MANQTKWMSMLILAAGTAVATTTCDWIHVFTGTLTYTDPFLFGQSWFVFPGFTLAFLLMMVVYNKMFSLVPDTFIKTKSMSHGNLNDTVESFTIFVLIYMMSGFGSEFPMLLNIIFYGSFLIRLMTTYERPFIITFAIVLAIGGIMGEGLLVVANLVEYSHPEIFHVPIWLGAVYMHGALALRELMRYFIYADTQSA